MAIFYLLFLAVIVCVAIPAWIAGVRMRRKAQKDLGRKVSERDLTSISTWTRLNEIEEQKKGGKRDV